MKKNKKPLARMVRDMLNQATENAAEHALAGTSPKYKTVYISRKTGKPYEFQAHERLRSQMQRFPRLWQGTIFDLGGKGDISEAETVTYRELVAEYDFLRSRTDMAEDVAEKLAKALKLFYRWEVEGEDIGMDEYALADVALDALSRYEAMKKDGE